MVVKTIQEQIKRKEFIMPMLDRTGPMGRGPMTGRGMGRCVYYGFGQGRNLKYRQLQGIDDDSKELNYLKDQLEAELLDIKQRIAKIESQEK